MNDSDRNLKKRKGKKKSKEMQKVEEKEQRKVKKSKAQMPVSKTQDSSMKSLRVASAIYYLIVICIMGLPIWYITTTPSRHSLPDISSLLVHSQMIAHKIPVTVITIRESISRDNLRYQLVNNWPRKVSSDGSITYEFEWRVRRMIDKEEDVFKNFSSLVDIDNSLNQIESHHVKGRIMIYLVPDSLISKEGKGGSILGSSRSIYLSDKVNDIGTFSESIIDTLDLILEPHKIASGLMQENSDAIKFLIGSEMDLVINIVAEDIKDAIDFTNSNKLNSLHELSDRALLLASGILELINFKITSQMVYNSVPRDFIRNNLINSSERVRLYGISNVAQLFNTIESRIVEHNSKELAKLIVFIPSTKEPPMKFYDPQIKEESNLIMTMHKDAIVIWENEMSFNKEFKSYIRSLIGLNDLQHTNSLKKDIFFSHWEIDGIIRQVSSLQLSKTLSSLESIQKLLLKVSNIVILEEIAKRMHSAVDLSHKSINDLANGELSSAFISSTKAYEASETAFFDPSLLALLYFPDDQKYAIYFPLFLPVSLPLATSIFTLTKLLSSKIKSGKSKKD